MAGLLVVHGYAMGAWAADASEAVRQAIVRFADALNAGDAAQLRATIWTAEDSKAQELGRDALVDLIVAEKRLERVAANRFGAEGKRFRCGFDLIFSAEDRESVAKASVVFDDPSIARVIKPGEIWTLRVRRSGQRDWRVALDIIDFDLDDHPNEPSTPNDLSLLRIERLRSAAEAVNLVASRIEQGETASVMTAESELLERLAKISADFRSKLERLPDRYQGGREGR
ncbi:MAG: hypothetical protein ACM359_20380 [Bacillota bacterium]